MSNINDQIARRINAFASELQDLVRQAAIDAVAQALGVTTSRRPGRPAAAPKAPAAGGGGGGSRRRAGGKRPPEELAAMVDKAASWIKSNPGQGVETMAKGLGVQTKELALPIAKLLKNKTIKKRGQKRATKYFPG